MTPNECAQASSDADTVRRWCHVPDAVYSDFLPSSLVYLLHRRWCWPPDVRRRRLRGDSKIKEDEWHATIEATTAPFDPLPAIGLVRTEAGAECGMIDTVRESAHGSADTATVFRAEARAFPLVEATMPRKI